MNRKILLLSLLLFVVFLLQTKGEEKNGDTVLLPSQEMKIQQQLIKQSPHVENNCDKQIDNLKISKQNNNKPLPEDDKYKQINRNNNNDNNNINYKNNKNSNTRNEQNENNHNTNNYSNNNSNNNNNNNELQKVEEYNNNNNKCVEWCLYLDKEDLHLTQSICEKACSKYICIFNNAIKLGTYFSLLGYFIPILLGVSPVGPISGGFFATNQGSQLIAGSMMSRLQSLTMRYFGVKFGAFLGGTVSIIQGCENVIIDTGYSKSYYYERISPAFEFFSDKFYNGQQCFTLEKATILTNKVRSTVNEKFFDKQERFTFEKVKQDAKVTLDMVTDNFQENADILTHKVRSTVNEKFFDEQEQFTLEKLKEDAKVNLYMITESLQDNAAIFSGFIESTVNEKFFDGKEHFTFEKVKQDAKVNLKSVSDNIKENANILTHKVKSTVNEKFFDEQEQFTLEKVKEDAKINLDMVTESLQENAVFFSSFIKSTWNEATENSNNKKDNDDDTA
eukprot:Pgem_evm1s2120